jgi:hypothetical protein
MLAQSIGWFHRFRQDSQSSSFGVRSSTTAKR